jgi:autotransporter strand-loop-strand O-heptosyltransferase
MKKQAFYTISGALGDAICATPVIRKLSEVYNSKITVISKYPKIFQNCPYVEESLHIEEKPESDFSSIYDLHKSFFLLGRSDSRGIEFKHALCDIRQFHAKDLGFMLTPDELHCDYFPDSDHMGFNLPEKYVVIHPVQSWGSRTWSPDKWQTLCDLLNEKGIPVIAIGKNSGEYFDAISQNKPTFELNIKYGTDLTNQTNLDQTWNILNQAACVVTMDSGILHLAGTTNTHIIQLGSSIKWEFRAPYREGRQDYKYKYILGGCSIHCASDMRYSLKEWGNIQAVPPLDGCLENKKSFECHPDPFKVLDPILKLWEEPVTKKNIVSENIENDIHLIKINSVSLGDNIGAIAAISSYQKKVGFKIEVSSKLGYDYFKNSYPNLTFVPYETEPSFDPIQGVWSTLYKKYKSFRNIYYLFDRPLIKGYADQLGITEWEDPRIDVEINDRPVKNKYVCFSMHSTAQSKNWNYPGGWDKLCRMLRKEGYTPICIDRFTSFGIEGNWNTVPDSCVKRNGMDLKEMINYIYHSEFFIGLSSGLSWVAHAVGKKVIMISGVTSEDNEFEKNCLRLINKDVCHGCINKPEHKFEAGDWMWCPVNKGTEKQFECTTTITPEQVMSKIIEGGLI